MIAMFLSPGHVDADKQLYSGQAGFQAFLLFMAFISVPWMLFVKPHVNKKRHEKAQQEKALLGSAHQSDSHGAFDHSPIGVDISGVGEERKHGEFVDELNPFEVASPPVQQRAPAEAHGGGHGGHGGEYDFSDEMIHQGIHTIEFVLGAVSNTASYLRLWALSLAHAQLSAVFWEKMIMRQSHSAHSRVSVLFALRFVAHCFSFALLLCARLSEYGAETGNAFMMFIGFSIWFASTFAVLLCMDVLECFLHALRLHWVEFQNKFYNADGIAFEPFALVPVDKKD